MKKLLILPLFLLLLGAGCTSDTSMTEKEFVNYCTGFKDGKAGVTNKVNGVYYCEISAPEQIVKIPYSDDPDRILEDEVRDNCMQYGQKVAVDDPEFEECKEWVYKNARKVLSLQKAVQLLIDVGGWKYQEGEKVFEVVTTTIPSPKLVK